MGPTSQRWTTGVSGVGPLTGGTRASARAWPRPAGLGPVAGLVVWARLALGRRRPKNNGGLAWPAAGRIWCGLAVIRCGQPPVWSYASRAERRSTRGVLDGMPQRVFWWPATTALRGQGPIRVRARGRVRVCSRARALACTRAVWWLGATPGGVAPRRGTPARGSRANDCPCPWRRSWQPKVSPLGVPCKEKAAQRPDRDRNPRSGAHAAQNVAASTVNSPALASAGKVRPLAHLGLGVGQGEAGEQRQGVEARRRGSATTAAFFFPGGGAASWR